MGDMVPFLIFVFIAVFFIVWGIKNAKATRRKWRRFAERHGLEFSGERLLERPSIRGSYKGVSLQIHIEMQGSGRNRHAYTRYTARFNAPLPPGLNITGEGFKDKIVKLFGGQDIQVGIRRVDDALRVKGSDEARVRGFLQDEAVFAAVMKLVTSHGGAISGGTATLRNRGYAGSEDLLQSKADAVANTVRDVEQALGRQRPVAVAEAAVAPSEMKDGNQGAGSDGRGTTVDASASNEPSASLPIAEPAPAASTDADLDAELSKLRDGTASFLERPEIIKRIKGRRLSGSMTVAQTTWTTSFHLSERVRNGQTAVGTMPDGLLVAVSFVKERDDETKALKRGDELKFCGRVAHWDDVQHRLLLEAE